MSLGCCCCCELGGKYPGEEGGLELREEVERFELTAAAVVVAEVIVPTAPVAMTSVVIVVEEDE